MSEKLHEQSLEAFYRAKNYKNTAEVNTLIAWCYSFKSDFSKAKNYCLKAIAIDPEYGPPYNDFGNYLLSEGEVDESFKWFELAKRAPNYQNREYPYINTGRAYMLKEKYSEALREFSYALILAPYHFELHETVKKLRSNLEGRRKFNQMDQYESNRI
jgi:Tfp pilus assembly protein PilF